MAQLMAQDVAQLLHVVVLVGQEQPRAQKAVTAGVEMASQTIISGALTPKSRAVSESIAA